MPTPGSHKFDVEQSRVRSQLEDRGIPDDRAEAEARELLDAREDIAPAEQGDRARGPLGERGGGGDPGEVLELRSPAFSDDTVLPVRFTKVNANVSPPLEWSAPPAGSAELAIVCEEPDAPSGTFTHWLVTGVDPVVTAVAEGADPGGVTWPNSFGQRRYDGPLPPVGDDAHRYVFRVFSFDRPLDLSPEDGSARVRAALEDQRTRSGTLTGPFAR